eukprot:scaffold18081_cov89-Isochrysis_galbana.AAC.5
MGVIGSGVNGPSSRADARRDVGPSKGWVTGGCPSTNSRRSVGCPPWYSRRAGGCPSQHSSVIHMPEPAASQEHHGLRQGAEAPPPAYGRLLAHPPQCARGGPPASPDHRITDNASSTRRNRRGTSPLAPSARLHPGKGNNGGGTQQIRKPPPLLGMSTEGA